MIVYIHGYNSSGQCVTASMLRKYYPELVSPSWDTKNPKKTIKELVDLVYTADDSEEVILVASSLGGFIAEAVANYCSVGLVLVNPSLNPEESLKKYSDITEDSIKEYSEINLQFKKAPRRIILSSDDKVVDPQNAKEIYSKIAKVINIEGGHRIVESMIPVIIKEINNTINTLYE